MFMGYLKGIWRNLRFLLISVVNFYYIINKLKKWYLTHTNLVPVHHLKYLSIDISLFLTIRSGQMNTSRWFQTL
jgi:hypothetical protein